jgi:hypothetical protein
MAILLFLVAAIALVVGWTAINREPAPVGVPPGTHLALPGGGGESGTVPVGRAGAEGVSAPNQSVTQPIQAKTNSRE